MILPQKASFFSLAWQLLRARFCLRYVSELCRLGFAVTLYTSGQGPRYGTANGLLLSAMQPVTVGLWEKRFFFLPAAGFDVSMEWG